MILPLLCSQLSGERGMRVSLGIGMIEQVNIATGVR